MNHDPSSKADVRSTIHHDLLGFLGLSGSTRYCADGGCSARYIRLTANREVDGKPFAAVAEVDVLLSDVETP